MVPKYQLCDTIHFVEEEENCLFVTAWFMPEGRLLQRRFRLLNLHNLFSF